MQTFQLAIRPLRAWPLLLAALALAACDASDTSTPAAGGGGDDDGGGGGEAACVGVSPTGAPAAPGVLAPRPDDPGCTAPTCRGVPAPSWQAADFQPQSCGFQHTYGLDAFRGHVTVVALLAGW